MRKKVICFSGIDGSGKSVHAQLVFKELKSKGIKCEYKWLRYPRFFSFVPLALLNLTISAERPSRGFNEVRIKTHFKKNKVVVTLWILITYVDAFLSTVRHIYLPSLFGYTLVLDRFIIDTLVDTAFNLRNEMLIFGVMGKLFLKLIPKNSLVLIFDIKESIAAFRKNYTNDINSLTKKRILYESLSKIYQWNIIYTDKPILEVHNEVMKLME